MENRNENLIRHAMMLVHIVNEEYLKGTTIAYFPLLAGIGSYLVESDGESHNYYAVLDAIHQYYLRDEKSKCDQGFQDGLKFMIEHIGKTGILQDVLNYLYYQLKLEKEGNDSFKVDSVQIVNLLNGVIKRKYADFQSETPHFEKWFQRNQEYALENFGIQLG